ncbi:unnamed protein product [Oncorhynchus mykiss]|uniref:TIAM Rac1 associated GEF 2a n=1 Tax=Oncorhynchus mykiss TaxID=8022 RepID=A0A060XJ46_ONCMY|nr:unnamed protein product [Oncorhynchus mykiss]
MGWHPCLSEPWLLQICFLLGPKPLMSALPSIVSLTELVSFVFQIAMGNSESQYSLQGPKGTSLILPGKQKPYSLKFRSTKEEVLSPHTWWKGGPGGSGYKARTVGRGCLSPPQRRGEPYVSRHYDYVTMGVKGSPNCRRWHDSPPGGGSQLPSENGCCPFEGSGRLDSRASGELNDHALNGHRNPERMPGEGEGLEEQSSPRVVIKKDGSLRVEFTNTNSGLLLDEASGPVQLLKFSPTLESTPSLPGSSRRPEAHHGAPQPASTSTTRTSKGSSLSSEGSWYDSPWGHSADLCDQDQSCSPSRTMGNSGADQLEAFGQQSPLVSISDLYRDPSMAATFPTAKDLSAQYRESPHHIQHRASFVSALDVPTEEECPEARQYSSYTLPCRKARPSGERSTLKKGSGAVRSRMRRLSDWTGSLSRKKRKTQLGSRAQLWFRGTLHPPSQPLRSSPGPYEKQLGSAETNKLQFEVILLRCGLPPSNNHPLPLPAGCTLLFYGKGSPEQELSPRYALFAEDSIVQAVPEHPKKENVFCLSNNYGDVYLFQAGNQTDMENWVTAIHSASASLFAKRHGKEDTLRLLRSQIRGLLQKVDMDGKMKKMAELQLSIVSDPKNRKAIENQIQQWEQNLEKFNMDLFRMRCYLASLQGGELPNPKSLLAAASRPSKTALGRLGIFSVSSFHALICSRDEATLRRRSMSLSQRSRNKRGLFSSLKGLDNFTKKGRDKRPSTEQIFESDEGGQAFCLPHTSSEVSFAVTGHIDGQRNSRVFVSEVLSDGLAFSEGLRPDDEIVVLNGRGVSTLDLRLIQMLFSEQTLQLTLRREAASTSPLNSGPSTPTPLPNQSQLLQDFLDTHHRAKSTTDVSLVPEVPGESQGSGLENRLQHSRHSHRAVQHSKSVETLYHTFQEGSGGLMEGHKDPPNPGAEPTLLRTCPRHMSSTERLSKVIQELVDTEKSYVKDLSCLFEIYLKPLQNETFLTLDEMDSLFGSLPEMLDFQRVFLQTLEERIASSPDFRTLETPEQFKKLLFSLGGSFLYYADHFKLYSGFCANHIKVQKVLGRVKTDLAFKEFLDARNPTKQHSSTLESYLIKPVQRVLKYPLLLRELVSLTDTDSEEHYHLTEALKAMEKVASHINEMQKIYEDYGSVFDQLVAEQSGPEKEVTELSMGEFLMHSSVVWLNPHVSLGRMRKDPDLTVFVFKKAVILVYRESNKLKKKMTAPRLAHSHGDLDPFKFRWLIPLSALQVRLGNTTGTETTCIWELIHTKSELEGRPETVFQLCSSVPECKVNIIKVIRSILRENVRRNMRPAERGCKERLTPLRSTLPSSARIGSTRASWLCKQPLLDLPSPTSTLKPGQPDSDEGSLSSGTHSSSGAPPANGPTQPKTLPTRQAWSRGSLGSQRSSVSSSVKESDILSDEDDDEFSESGGRQEGQGSSQTSAIEAQFLSLRLSEEAASSRAPAPRVQPEGAEVDTPESPPKLVQGHICPVKRKGSSSLRHSLGEHSHSLDSQTDVATMDLNALLEREFSVQSLTSVVNEDCFYDPTDSSDTTYTGSAPNAS